MDSSILKLRALGILLMVFGHVGAAGCNPLNNFIYMFHMPLFFFISGYCFKEKYLYECRLFFCRRIKRLYVPFILWGIIFLLLHNVFFYLNFYSYDYGFKGHGSCMYSLSDFIQKIMGTIVMHNTEQLLGGYWFLHSLFCGTIIAWVLLKYVKSYVACIGITLFTGILCNKFNLSFFDDYVSSREISAAFLFVVGNYFSKKQIKNFNSFYIFGCFILTLCGSVFWHYDMSSGNCSNKIYLPYLFTSVLAVWSLYSLIVKCQFGSYKASRLLCFIGSHTMEILTWHFLCFKLVSFFIVEIYGLPLARIAEFPSISEYTIKGWWGAYFLVGVFVPLIFPYLRKNTKLFVFKQ